MLCNVTNFREIERENEMSYFIIKATGVEGDDSADAVVNGIINPFACMSRRFNFTKTLFPSTDAQADALRKAFKTDDDGNVSDGAQIRLMSYQWAAPAPFYIVKEDAVTGVYETEEEITETVTRNGKKVQETKTKYIPKLFTTVNLTLFEDENGNCVENGGDADGLCKRTFERAIANGMYLLAETATDIQEIVQ